jgi:NADH:ubiquinone oxidoreductase subunit E
MIKITVCIGSSCHIKGSRQVVEGLQNLIAEHNLGGKIELGGTFCMGKCQQGVCVTVNDEFYSVTPENVNEFFNTEVLAKV